LSLCSKIIRHFKPTRAQAAAVCLAWLDCTAPTVTINSALFFIASGIKNSNFLVLFPPVAKPVQSSLFIKIFGPPKYLVIFFRCSIGVGK